MQIIYSKNLLCKTQVTTDKSLKLNPKDSKLRFKSLFKVFLRMYESKL